MHDFLKTALCLLAMPAALATPLTTPVATSGDATHSHPSDPCNTFIVRATSGKYKGVYLGPSDPLSLEITNSSEAAQFAIYPERKGQVQKLPEHDILLTFNDTHSGVLWDDSQGKPYGGIYLECAFALPFVAAGRLRCTTPNDETVFYTCPQNGEFLGIGVDENQYTGCEKVELEGIPTCFHH